MRRFVLLLLLATPAFAKSLYWEALNVTAHLDAGGMLHIKEQQAYVFDGDWNGGERSFRLNLNQKLDFNGITRIDRDGREVPLVRGDLNQVDHWNFTSGNVVRWRSRSPSSPQFSNERIVYVLDYALANVLRETSDGHYLLDHDFAFPDRQGDINIFTLDLTFDPAWNTAPLHVERDNLAPGQSVVLTRDLTFTGVTRPAAFVPAPAWAGLACALALLAGMIVFIGAFLLNQQRTGRFNVLDVNIEEAWLRANVFAMKPEVAGAAWDAKTGAAEVAAVLARLTTEGRITTRAEYKTLYMHLNQPLTEFSGYEHDLLAAMFFAGTDTDTSRIKSHYQHDGFDPSRLIADGIAEQMRHLPARGERVKRFDWRYLFVIIALIAIASFAAVLHSKADLFAVAVACGITCFFTLFSAGLAGYHSSALTGIGWRLFIVALLFSPGPIATIVIDTIGRQQGIGALTMAALTLVVIACWKAVLDALKIADSPSYIALRQRLLAARNYFKKQLRSSQPQLQDDWLPYLLAFGLGSNVDRWFRSFGGRDTSNAFGSTYSSSSSSSSAASSSSPGWTGGGGAFGGAGATGAWAAAAGTLAAGVAAPSSSGSGGGGGGGGGGGSSGGGGGGGW